MIILVHEIMFFYSQQLIVAPWRNDDLMVDVLCLCITPSLLPLRLRDLLPFLCSLSSMLLTLRVQASLETAETTTKQLYDVAAPVILDLNRRYDIDGKSTNALNSVQETVTKVQAAAVDVKDKVSRFLSMHL
jgi:hypothetical protein